jgi:ABC-type nickel/cobalt efflux system permease component RcnA
VSIQTNPQHSFTLERGDQFEHINRIWSVIGTALVWAGLWFLMEVCFAGLSVQYQLVSYALIVFLGITILYRVSKNGFLS